MPPKGPDCDWCGADEEDMDVYTVSEGDDFICQDCYDRLVEAAPELLAVCQAIASDVSLFQFTDGEYRLSEFSAGVILQSLREVIAKVEGRN